ncbi:MAG: MobF family relaxase [Cyanobacteria bacterium J06659_2]
MSNVSASQAENYYEKDDYYTQGSTESESQGDAKWFGQGAAALSLVGAVDKPTFQKLLQGQSPNGKPLQGRRIDPAKHRAATDYTFSAPKAVSIAGLIQRDDRVIVAHDQAVKTAISVLEERYAQTRVRTEQGRQRMMTGNVVAAVFRHETSREQEPQLHSHCVVINATQLPDGSWRSLSNEEIVANQKLLGEIYQNELAYQLRQGGYEIDPLQNGQFELKGYSQELLEIFSTRRQQILELLKRWEAERSPMVDTNGNAISSGAARRETANLRSRRRKQIIPREVLLAGWREAIETQNLTLPPIPDGPSTQTRFHSEQLAAVVSAGIDHAAEREAVFRRGKVERFVLENHLGQQNFGDLQQAIAATNQLISIDPLKDKVTTQQVIQRELETIRLMQWGQGKVGAIATLAGLEQWLEQASTLTKGQRDAIAVSATTSDRVMAWQGVAGVGKTYSLRLFRELAESKDYVVKGFAPSAEAANSLTREVGFSSDTVAGLLCRQVEPDETLKPEIWIVDEAGLLSARDAHDLLSKAEAQQARVILVGDTRQLSAVEAGNPFRSLQAGGIRTVYLTESLRQKTQDLKASVKLLEAGQIETALEKLDQSGAIQEASNLDDRLKRMTQDYMGLSLEERERTLILAGTNAERLALTAHIRAALQGEGQLGPDIFRLTSLRSRDLTTAQAKYANQYAIGDVVVPTQDYKRQGLIKHQQYGVVGIAPEANQLTLETPHGQLITVDPARCERKTVYGVQQVAIAVGDRLRWTRNDRAAGIRNGQRFTVKQIDVQGQAQIVDAEGKTSQIDLSGRQFADYALVNTTYSSQGKTADRVLAVMDSTTSRESFYVATSRAKHQLTLYTADKGELVRWAQRSRAKENVGDYIPLFQVNHYGQTQKNTSSIPDGGDVGERIGERVSQKLAAALWRDGDVEAAEYRTATAAQQLSDSTSGLSRTVEQLERAVDSDAESTNPDEPDVERIAEAIGERIWQRQVEQFAAAFGAVDSVVSGFECQGEQRCQFAARLSEGVGKLERSLERWQRRLAVNQKRRHYQGLWQRYSRGVRADSLKQLDKRVVRQAFQTGVSRREIGLMLVAGSRYVRWIDQQQGNNRALAYVNWQVQQVCQPQIDRQRVQSRARQLEL